MAVMSIQLALQIAAATGALSVVAAAGASQIVIEDKPGHISEATVVLDASPAEVYAFVTDYGTWTAHLTDVRDVKVESPGRETARVRFRSRALAHEVTVLFSNEPNRLIRFTGIKGPPGARAHGSFTLDPIDGGTRTRVFASMYLDVVGVPSMFVSDSKIKNMRHAKLRADMADVMAAFPPRREENRPQASAP